MIRPSGRRTRERWRLIRKSRNRLSEKIWPDRKTVGEAETKPPNFSQDEIKPLQQQEN
jgi:hypothetical protein